MGCQPLLSYKAYYGLDETSASRSMGHGLYSGPGFGKDQWPGLATLILAHRVNSWLPGLPGRTGRRSGHALPQPFGCPRSCLVCPHLPPCVTIFPPIHTELVFLYPPWSFYLYCSGFGSQLSLYSNFLAETSRPSCSIPPHFIDVFFPLLMLFYFFPLVFGKPLYLHF